MVSICTQRLERELPTLLCRAPEGVSVIVDEANLTKMKAVLMGPPDSPYEGGYFEVEVHATARYPFEPPRVKFLTKIYHPNIDEEGRICLDLLKMPPNGDWKPFYDICNVLRSIRMLLGEPNPYDALVADIGDEMITNREEYKRKAAEYTKIYAALK